MKKKVAMLLTGVMAVSLLMTGCQSTKGLENDNIKISVYKGVEVDKVDKPSEVTDDDVNTQIIHWRSVLILSSKDLKTVLSDTRSVIHLTGTESSRRIMEVLILQAKM